MTNQPIDYSTRTPFETKTYELFAEELNREWTPETVMIAAVFKSQWISTLPVDQIERIAAAIHNYEKVDLADALTKLVRRKVLRSRSIRGVRHYEVNY